MTKCEKGIAHSQEINILITHQTLSNLRMKFKNHAILQRLFLFLILGLMIHISEATEKPNIIMVMPDDMGYGDLGATGNPVIRTPHLDKLAKESVELTNFYVSPVCSPTRACLMTGRYNYRTRVVDTFKGRSMMDPNEWTVAEALKTAGYTTGIFGKWHLGDNHPLRPQDQGFDDVLIHRGGGLAQPSEPIENKRRYTNAILFENGKEIQSKGYCTDVYFDAAMDFMDDAANRNVPFFAYIPPNAPHGPYHDVPQELLEYYQSIDLDPILGNDKSDRHKDTVARVFAMIENIDQNMGRMDSFLKKKGLKNNTIVLFFTDNGPNTMRYVGPFRGMKSWVHEGGIHTCFYARWPDRFKAGHQNDRIAAHIDLMPTFLDIAGVKVPKSVHLDGKSLLPLLSGTPTDWQDRTLYIQTHRGDQPIAEHHVAVRNQNWKLVHPTGFGKSTMTPDIPFELYHISKDPGESKDLASTYPDKVHEMRQAYANWLSDVSSTRKDNYAPPRMTIGSEQQSEVDLSIQDWRVAPNSTGWGNGGTWYIDVVDQGPYDVTLQFENEIEAKELTILIGNQSHLLAIKKGEMTPSLKNIKLPLGKTTLKVQPVKTRATTPRFVTITKK